MDLDYKILLMDALINENRDVTIGEYWETLAEVEGVESHNTTFIQVKRQVIIYEPSKNQP